MRHIHHSDASQNDQSRNYGKVSVTHTFTTPSHSTWVRTKLLVDDLRVWIFSVSCLYMMCFCEVILFYSLFWLDDMWDIYCSVSMDAHWCKERTGSDWPTALKTKMKTSVQDTKPVSQAHLDLSTAEIPKKMKMMVSAMLARVFIVYFTVVRDFWEMLASTYLLAPIPQKVILRREREWLVRACSPSADSRPATGSPVTHIQCYWLC